MQTSPSRTVSRIVAGVLLAASVIPVLPGLTASYPALAAKGAILAALAIAAAATARLGGHRAGSRPIRLTGAFLLVAALHLPPAGAFVVLGAAALAARGGGLAGVPGWGISQAAANFVALAMLTVALRAFPPSDAHLGVRGLVEVVAAFLVFQAAAVAARLLLALAAGNVREVLARPALGRLAVEALNPALAWLLLVQLELSTPLSFGALAAVIVLGGYALRALDRAFRELHAANQALAARVTELATLHAIGREILSSLDPDRVCRIIERECRKIFDVDFFFLALVDRDTHELRVLHRAERGQDPRVSVLPIGEGLASWIVRNKRGILVEDFTQPTPGLPFRPTVVEPGIRSALAVPLIVEDRVVGVLSIQSRRDHAYDDHLLSVLTTIAQQAAVALENARHYAMATVDSLTGLFLRDYFFRRLEEEYSRAARYGGAFAVLMLDLDAFKTINDRHGHLAGDRYLRALGQTIRTRLRAADLACRYGGDEFCLLLPETDLEGARPIAERLRAAIGALTADIGGGTVRSTVSIGLAAYPDHDTGDLKALLLRADQALYQAKRSGRDRVVSFAA